MITSSLRHYLYRAVRNRARNAARHGKSVARIASLAALDIVAAHDADPAPTVEESLQFQELSAAIHEAIDQLPAASRSAYALRWEGWSYTEIAQALGISVKNVETRIGRALRILRTTLGHLR